MPEGIGNMNEKLYVLHFYGVLNCDFQNCVVACLNFATIYHFEIVLEHFHRALIHSTLNPYLVQYLSDLIQEINPGKQTLMFFADMDVRRSLEEMTL